MVLVAEEAVASEVVEQEEVGRMSKELITILGPTASGKTSFATHLANSMDGEIISADSRQVYRGMDIGTGKDLSEYVIDGVSIPYHLIDIRVPGDKYTLFEYQHDFHEVYTNILSRGKNPLLCGGTGLYIESVLRGYNLPDVPVNDKLRKSLENKTLDELTEILISYRSLHNTTDTDTKKRAIRAIEIEYFKAEQNISKREFPPIKSCVIGISLDRDLRRKKISERLKTRLEEGMVEEVKSILNSGVTADDLIYYGLEYKFVTQFVIGEISFDDMCKGLEVAIHQFAKRQMTWFRGMERRGIKINWIDATLPMDKKIAKAYSFIRG